MKTLTVPNFENFRPGAWKYEYVKRGRPANFTVFFCFQSMFAPFSRIHIIDRVSTRPKKFSKICIVGVSMRPKTKFFMVRVSPRPRKPEPYKILKICLWALGNPNNLNFLKFLWARGNYLYLLTYSYYIVWNESFIYFSSFHCPTKQIRKRMKMNIFCQLENVGDVWWEMKCIFTLNQFWMERWLNIGYHLGRRKQEDFKEMDQKFKMDQ